MHNIPCGNRRKALINLQNQGHDLRGKLVEDIGTRDISFVSKKTHLVSDYLTIDPLEE